MVKRRSEGQFQVINLLVARATGRRWISCLVYYYDSLLGFDRTQLFCCLYTFSVVFTWNCWSLWVTLPLTLSAHSAKCPYRISGGRFTVCYLIPGHWPKLTRKLSASLPAGKLVISSNVRSHWLIEGCEKREINDITRRCCLPSSIRIYEDSYKKKLEFFLNTRAKSHCPTVLSGGFVTWPYIYLWLSNVTTLFPNLKRA